MWNRNENVVLSPINDVPVVQPKNKVSRRLSIIREFSLNTSTHALPGIARSESLHNRIFWSLSFISFTGLMIYFVVKAILAYFDYPTSMDTSFISEWPQEFPAFSFCNISPLRRDLFWKPFLNYSIMNNRTSANDIAWDSLSLLDLTKFLIYTLNRNETLDKYFYSLSSMMYKCSFNDMPCSVNDFVPFTSFVYGACYTFNAALKNNASRNTVYANEHGGDGKLSIGLYIHSHQYVPSLMEGFGAVAIVHDNTQLPNIEAAGIELASGRRHKLGYRKKTTYLLSSPYTTCTEKVSTIMQAMFEYYHNINYGYSEALCYQLCGQVYAYEQCGCVSPVLWNGRKLYVSSMNRVVFAPLCEFDNMCYKNAIGKLLTSPFLMQDYCSECLQECIIKNFIVQTSSLSLPGEWEMEKIKKFVENSTIPLPTNWSSTWQDEIRKNYLTINVVRETSVVENSTQSASMGVVDVFSNVGGQTGLWIGISLLSIMELVEMLYRLIRNEFHKIRRKIQMNRQ
ncbi:unnamed protein product [Rotaria sp. Silwood1]|nr:unnamed protein product [Rotaria sp. Silwood1]CAF1378499.1 unnamed protein product [Rotaria sp. Silwood1]